MPVTDRTSSPQSLYQRDQYAKGGLGRLYWDYRDRIALSHIQSDDRRIIDLGCGEGITLEKLLRAFPSNDILGLDLLEENIAICRRHGLPVCQADAGHLDLPDGAADAVLFMEVIEHLDHPEAVLAEIRRILKPRGKLIVVYPNDGFFKLARILTLRFTEARFDPGHVKQWTPRSMAICLRESGFEVAKTRCIPFGFWPVCLHGVICARKG